jgi:6-phosphogluconate dehydrogenase
MVDAIENALLAAKIVSYAQGFALMQIASDSHTWKLDGQSIALIWRAGCIIRSVFLDRIAAAYGRNQTLPNLLLDGYFQNTIQQAQADWRQVAATAIVHGMPIAALAAGLTYYDGLRSERLPANLLQAQRDFFGAHTYERIDQPRGRFFHTEWD